jgi:hypothetical protein
VTPQILNAHTVSVAYISADMPLAQKKAIAARDL